MSGILIKDGYIITLDNRNAIFERGTVGIENDRIVYVGKNFAEALGKWRFDVTIDARGFAVLPGLIDTHVHLAQALLRGLVPDNVSLLNWLKNWVWPLQGSFDEEDGKVSAQLCILEMLKSGTTTFVEAMLHRRYGLDGIAEAVVKSGIRGVLSKTVMDNPGYAEFGNVMHAGMIEDRDQSLNDFKIMHRRWNGVGDGKVSIWLGPRTPGACSTELYRTIAELAKNYQTGVTMHLAETKEDIDYFNSLHTTPGRFVQELGLTGERRIFAHCVWLPEEDMPVFAKSGTTVAHCPSSNMKLGSGVAPIIEMVTSGVNVALGCDGGPSNDAYDMFRDMKLAALLQKGVNLRPASLTALDTLRLATLNGARAVGLPDQIGSIEVGKKADVILIDLLQPHLQPFINPVSNIVYAAVGSDVHTVIVDGKVVVRERHALTLDEEFVLNEASRRAEALLSKAGLGYTS